ncbi:MAG: hypothetical protein IPM82_05520 [Saprospiraceae bacterium]|nr:hypothetical protein [Saprospiraceae bacterium]
MAKIIAPAVAANGLPVMAIQCLPCSGGFWVVTGRLLKDWARIVPGIRRAVIRKDLMDLHWKRFKVMVACYCVQFAY